MFGFDPVTFSYTVWTKILGRLCFGASLVFSLKQNLKRRREIMKMDWLFLYDKNENGHRGVTKHEGQWGVVYVD